MTKVVLWNLPEATSEERIRAALEPYAPILSVSIEREGDPHSPAAVIDFDLDSFAVGNVVRRLDGLWHEGSFLRAHVLMHP